MTVKKLWPHQMNDFWGSRVVKGKSRLWWRDGRRRRRTESPGAYKGSSRHPSLGDGSQMSDPAGLLQLIWNERLLVFFFNHFCFRPQGTIRSECVLGFISPTYHLQSISFETQNGMGRWSNYSPSTDACVHMCGLVPPAALLTYIISSVSDKIQKQILIFTFVSIARSFAWKHGKNWTDYDGNIKCSAKEKDWQSKLISG